MTRVSAIRTGALATVATVGLVGAGLFLGGAVASAEDPTPVPGQSDSQVAPGTQGGGSGGAGTREECDGEKAAPSSGSESGTGFRGGGRAPAGSVRY